MDLLPITLKITWMYCRVYPCGVSVVISHDKMGQAAVLGDEVWPIKSLCACMLCLAQVGDDVMGDVGGAQAAGCRTVLVKTGKYRPGDEAGQVLPTAVLASVAALPQWLQEHNALIQLVEN